MLNIAIKDQGIEEFITKEFKGDMESLGRGFVNYLMFLKAKQDVSDAKKEFKNGEFLEIDGAFDRVISKYAD